MKKHKIQNTNESTQSEMRQNPIQRTARTAHCASVHNTTQNSSDNLPSYLQTTIIAQMLSIGGEAVDPDITD